MQLDSGIHLCHLKVDGGASKNNFLMQFQADIINTPVCRPSCVETTAMGAAYLAGLATSFWKDRGEVISNLGVDREFMTESLCRRWMRSCGRNISRAGIRR